MKALVPFSACKGEKRSGTAQVAPLIVDSHRTIDHTYISKPEQLNGFRMHHFYPSTTAMRSRSRFFLTVPENVQHFILKANARSLDRNGLRALDTQRAALGLQASQRVTPVRFR